MLHVCESNATISTTSIPPTNPSESSNDILASSQHMLEAGDHQLQHIDSLTAQSMDSCTRFHRQITNRSEDQSAFFGFLRQQHQATTQQVLGGLRQAHTGHQRTMAGLDEHIALDIRLRLQESASSTMTQQNRAAVDYSQQATAALVAALDGFVRIDHESLQLLKNDYMAGVIFCSEVLKLIEVGLSLIQQERRARFDEMIKIITAAMTNRAQFFREWQEERKQAAIELEALRLYSLDCERHAHEARSETARIVIEENKMQLAAQTEQYRAVCDLDLRREQLALERHKHDSAHCERILDTIIKGVSLGLFK